MKTVIRILFCLLLVVPGVARAQSRLTIGQALDFWIGIAESEIVPAADAMPEEKYSFAPSPAMGEFQGVRTFGEQVKHLAANNYRMAAYILGQEPTPDQKSETGPAEVQTKAQIMAYVRGSFAMLHRAAGAITQENALQPMASYPSPRQKTRMQLAEDVVTHSYDHYGQMVEYLRMNGIVPPASRK